MVKLGFIVACLLLLFGFGSYKTSSHKNNTLKQNIKHDTLVNLSSNRLTLFRKFIKGFKQLSLPYQIYDITFEDSFIDTTFLNDGFPYAVCIGELPDTSNFFYLLYDVPTADGAIGLAVFNKNGIRIDWGMLSFDTPPFMCGSDYFSETILIRNDYSLSVVDTISQSKCDSADYEIPGTTKSYIEFITGQITPGTGKFDVSDMQEKTISSTFINKR